ncbi:MAG: acyltransferase [Novosphingobium sp.]
MTRDVAHVVPTDYSGATLAQRSDGIMSPERAAKPKILTLQAGRALAALAVVLHHAGLASSDFHGAFFGENVLVLGWLGVDFFFVLSGFIIAHTVFTSQRGLANYASARVRRVYLPYLPVGIGIALIYSFVPGLSQGNHAWSWLTSITLLPLDADPALTVAWTLKHEILFYLVFGISYFGGFLRVGLALWGLAIAAAQFTAWKHHVPLELINLEFFAGIAVAVAYQRGWTLRWVWLGAPAVWFCWILTGCNREFSVLVGLGFAFLLPPLMALENAGKLSVSPTLVFLGAASYAICLVHNPVISAVARLIPFGGWAFVIIAVAAGTAGGTGYYWLIERRILAWRPAGSATVKPTHPDIAVDQIGTAPSARLEP